MESSAERAVGAAPPPPERPQDDGVVAFLEHRVLGDLPVERIAQARHQLRVFLLGSVLFLFEAVQHDVRIGNALEPRQAALDLTRVGHASSGGGDALRPAGRVLLLLLGQAIEDVLAPPVVLAVGQVPVRGGRLEFTAPHLLHRAEVDRVDSHLSDQSFEKQDRADPAGDEQHLTRGPGVNLPPVEVRNQIGHRNVQQACR